MDTIKVNDSICLKPLSVEDSPRIYDVLKKERCYLEEWLPFLKGIITYTDLERYILSLLAESDTRGCIFSMWYEGVFTGLVGFRWINRIESNAEMAYWISEKYQGMGIVTLSAAWIIEYAFKVFRIKQVLVFTDVNNLKSKQIPLRLNFTHVETKKVVKTICGEEREYEMELYEKVWN